MDRKYLPDILKQHPGVLISVGYVAISLIGMLFSQALFSEFGVNYFNYAEISDFLLAVLREPMTFALAGGAIVVALLILFLTTLEHRWLTRRAPQSRIGKLYKRTSDLAYNNLGVVLFVFSLYCYLFLNLYGDWKSKQIKSGIGEQLTVELAGVMDEAGQAPRFDHVMLLGTSNQFVFVYDVKLRQVSIIPNENIARLIVGDAAEDPTATDPPASDPPASDPPASDPPATDPAPQE